MSRVVRCPACQEDTPVGLRDRLVNCRGCGFVIDREKKLTGPTRRVEVSPTPTVSGPTTAPCAPLGPMTGAAPTSESLVGRVLGDQFRLTAILGRGGMGVVYRGEHVAVDGLVAAVKVVRPEFAADPDFRRRLQDEANVLQRVQDPYVVRMLGFGLPALGQPYLIMEYVAGPGGGSPLTLEGEIARGTLSIEEGIQILIGAARGMEAAHAVGIIHRDLKPENILLDGQRRPKVSDFGIARWDRSAADTQRAICTPAYAAPEQLFGRPDIDERADIHCLGRALFQVMAEVAPEPGGTLPPPSTFRGRGDAALDAIVAKATAAERAERHQTMRELREALETWLARPPAVVEAPPVPRAPDPAPDPVVVVAAEVDEVVEPATPTVSMPPATVSVPREHRRRLVVTAPPELVGRSFTLSRSRIVIGRSDDCDVTLAHDTIAEHHAVVTFEGSGYTIADLTEGRGVKVNRVYVTATHLSDGDVIALGRVVLSQGR